MTNNGLEGYNRGSQIGRDRRNYLCECNGDHLRQANVAIRSDYNSESRQLMRRYTHTSAYAEPLLQILNACSKDFVKKLRKQWKRKPSLAYRCSTVEPWCECPFNVMNDAPCAHLKEVIARGIMPVNVVLEKLRWKFVRDPHFYPDPEQPYTGEKRLALLRLLLLIGLLFRTLTWIWIMMTLSSTPCQAPATPLTT